MKLIFQTESYRLCAYLKLHMTQINRSKNIYSAIQILTMFSQVWNLPTSLKMRVLLTPCLNSIHVIRKRQ